MRTNEIIEKQYDAGLMSVMDVLDVRRRLLSAELASSEARRRELVSVTSLCRALGGDWRAK